MPLSLTAQNLSYKMPYEAIDYLFFNLDSTIVEFVEEEPICRVYATRKIPVVMDACIRLCVCRVVVDLAVALGFISFKGIIIQVFALFFLKILVYLHFKYLSLLTLVVCSWYWSYASLSPFPYSGTYQYKIW